MKEYAFHDRGLRLETIQCSTFHVKHDNRRLRLAISSMSCEEYFVEAIDDEIILYQQ